MYPVVFHLGPLTIYAYGVLVASGLILGMGLAVKEAKRQDLDPQVILDLGFYVALAGIIGSRVFYVLQDFSFYFSNPLEIFKLWQGGLVFHGGLLCALPVGWFFLKRKQLSFWPVFDLFAPSLAIGQAVGRIGCFFAGCCYGAPTSLPWAVTFSDPRTLAVPGIPLHPVQLYDALGLLLIFLVLTAVRRHTRLAGELSCLYLVLHGTVRFVVEFFRGDPRSMLWHDTISLPQTISLLLMLGGLLSYCWLQHSRQRGGR
jgi:phosphatidylglycerol---prolipoprotein diacylglyceryl transferase